MFFSVIVLSLSNYTKLLKQFVKKKYLEVFTVSILNKRVSKLLFTHSLNLFILWLS